MKLNKAWWEHLAPKSMIGRRREVEQLLEDFIRADYGLEWARVAANPHGVLRLTPGQVITYVHHKVMAITGDLEQLYEAEEFLVEGHWDDERRLNMVPGGKSGLRYLRENGLLSNGAVPLPDDRDKILYKWLNDHPRLGLPAPWVTEKWKDHDWAIAQICGRDGRLSVVQVKAIRELANHYTPEEIYVRIGAKDVDQVKRVLDGKTYARIA